MDVTGVLSGIADKGWRIGLPFAFCCGLVLLAHQHNWPEPGVLAPWLGFATVTGALGLAVTVVAVFTGLGRWIKDGLSASRYKAERHQEMLALFTDRKREMYERIDLLAPFQKMKLKEVLESTKGSMFLMRHGDGPAQSLLESGFIQQGDHTSEGSVCKLHPLLEHERQAVIAHLSR